MSHQHPDNPPQQPTSKYNLPMDPVKGEGTINIGWPSRIHFTKLKPTSTYATMNDTDLEALMADIREFYSLRLAHPANKRLGQNCPGLVLTK